MEENSEYDKSADFDKSIKGNNNQSLNVILEQAKSKKGQLMKQLDKKLEEYVDEIIRKIDLKSIIEKTIGRGDTRCTFSVDAFENHHHSSFAVVVNSENNTMQFRKTMGDAYFAFCKRFKGNLRLVRYSSSSPSLDQYQHRFKLEWD